MKTIFPLSVLAVAIAALPGAAQTAKPHSAPLAKSAASATGCSKLPVISPKVPALPAGSPCFKPLYTITYTANPVAKLSDISPIEDPDLRKDLNIPLPETFTLSYVDSLVGSGALAARGKWYTIKYTGYLVDGTLFDSSDKHPELGGTYSFQQGLDAQGNRQVVTGMDTGLFGMRVGGKRRLFIPWLLAYGAQPHLTIPAKSDLIFDVELVKQSDSDPSPKPSAPAAAPAPSSTTAPAKTPAASAPPQPAAPKP